MRFATHWLAGLQTVLLFKLVDWINLIMFSSHLIFSAISQLSLHLLKRTIEEQRNKNPIETEFVQSAVAAVVSPPVCPRDQP